MQVEIQVLKGDAIRSGLASLARLRIEVFREFPYLYDGSEEYEAEYLEEFSEASGAVLVAAVHEGRLVGASTGLPLSEAHEEFIQPFRSTGEDPREWFYFGESVLKKAWRGRGIGKQFFREREAHAAELGFSRLAFCAVDRPSDHPKRAESDRTLDGFWESRGFRKQPNLAAELAWREVESGEEEILHRLTFWTKIGV